MNVEILETILDADEEMMTRIHETADIPWFDPNYTSQIDRLTAVVFMRFAEADTMKWREVESLVDQMVSRLSNEPL